MRRLLALLLLAGCAAPTPAPIATIAPPPPPSPVGLEKVLGAGPGAVIQLLGSPGLERQEGRGRQLQFVSGQCVLDVFFYPPPGGGETVATYADARLKDGRPLDAASCFQMQMTANAPIVAAPKPQLQPQPGRGRRRAKRGRG